MLRLVAHFGSGKTAILVNTVQPQSDIQLNALLSGEDATPSGSDNYQIYLQMLVLTAPE
jgi:hypothetical protein